MPAHQDSVKDVTDRMLPNGEIVPQPPPSVRIAGAGGAAADEESERQKMMNLKIGSIMMKTCGTTLSLAEFAKSGNVSMRVCMCTKRSDKMLTVFCPHRSAQANLAKTLFEGRVLAL